MTEDEKLKAEQAEKAKADAAAKELAEKDKRIAELEKQLKSAKGKAEAEPEEEDLTPYPTQADLDAAKSGAYSTRQSKAK